MNRLQNSIVRFLNYVTELENLIILLNIGPLSFLRVSFIADRSLVLIFYYFYFIPIATEHKSHSNLTTPDIQTRGQLEYK